MAQVLNRQETFPSAVDADLLNPNLNYTASLRGALQEISIDNIQNKTRVSRTDLGRVLSADEGLELLQNLDFGHPPSTEANFVKPKFRARAIRRRAVIEPETFEPLDAVQEESSCSLHTERSANVASTGSLGMQRLAYSDKENHPIPIDPLLTAEPKSSSDEFLKHLAATPIHGDGHSMPDWDLRTIRRSQSKMELPDPPSYELYQTTPRKSLAVGEVAGQAVSPALTFASERSSIYAGASSTSGSFSVPRIEDSLEELDKLEEELEAVKAVTESRQIAYPDHENPRKSTGGHAQTLKPSLAKRSSLTGQAATVRVKNSERTRPPIRRSASLIFHDRIQDESTGSPLPKSTLSRHKSVNSLSTTPRGTVKSTKPLTVPKFELPGEAVARRLREQREARKAQQAEAQKAYVAPPKPRPSKVLPKPTFELPGEAISRRKREEREARLQAQEEEERKKREFKARPVRLSITPSTFPRDTVASRARQGKTAQEADEGKQLDSSKRLSIGVARGGSLRNKSPQTRGRLSTMASHDDLSRATSTSTGSVGKRSTLSAEEAQQLKARGKEIFQRDNTRFKEDKEREKREREMTARTAREQAAERSRAASREWADKKRRKEQALRDAMQQGA